MGEGGKERERKQHCGIWFFLNPPSVCKPFLCGVKSNKYARKSDNLHSLYTELHNIVV